MIKGIEKKIDVVIENLRKKHFKVIHTGSKEEAREEILKLVNEDETVGVGGSKTIREIGVIEELLSRGNKVVHHWLPKTFIEEIKEARKKATRADAYLASTNAITLCGELVNMDTYGNRVSAMIYGPDRVIIVAGYNKIVKNSEEALRRIREETAPKNAERIGVKAPDTLCKVASIMYVRPDDTDITVILVNADLGY